MDEDFPERDYCEHYAEKSGRPCRHMAYISNLELSLKTGQVEKEEVTKRIQEERAKHCVPCKATTHMAFKAHPS